MNKIFRAVLIVFFALSPTLVFAATVVHGHFTAACYEYNKAVKLAGMPSYGKIQKQLGCLAGKLKVIDHSAEGFAPTCNVCGITSLYSCRGYKYAVCEDDDWKQQAQKAEQEKKAKEEERAKELARLKAEEQIQKNISRASKDAADNESVQEEDKVNDDTTVDSLFVSSSKQIKQWWGSEDKNLEEQGKSIEAVDEESSEGVLGSVGSSVSNLWNSTQKEASDLKKKFIDDEPDITSKDIKRIEYKDGSVYEGKVSNGKPFGKGTLTQADGNIKKGVFMDGRYVGSEASARTLLKETKSADVDELDWESYHFHQAVLNGTYTGKGSVSWSGYTYDGDWVKGERSGQGKLTWPNGNVYSGDFVNGKLIGQGRFTSLNGFVYEGTFIDGKRTGFGTITWPNGDTYTGEVIDGKRTGQGTFTWANGDKFSGQFVDGERKQGTFTLRESERLRLLELIRLSDLEDERLRKQELAEERREKRARLKEERLEKAKKRTAARKAAQQERERKRAARERQQYDAEQRQARAWAAEQAESQRMSRWLDQEVTRSRYSTGYYNGINKIELKSTPLKEPSVLPAPASSKQAPRKQHQPTQSVRPTRSCSGGCKTLDK